MQRPRLRRRRPEPPAPPLARSLAPTCLQREWPTTIPFVMASTYCSTSASATIRRFDLRERAGVSGSACSSDAERIKVERLTEEGFDRYPRHGIREGPEADQSSRCAFPVAGSEADLLEVKHLHSRPLVACRTVVVGVDTEAATLYRPDREPIWSERRPRLSGQGGVRDEACTGGARRNARARRPRPVVSDWLRLRPASARRRAPLSFRSRPRPR